jgi:small-conductance mechanosensitive channel
LVFRKERFIKTGIEYIIMFDWLFKKVKKDEFEQHKGAVQTALNNVKQDMHSLSTWVKHLHDTDSGIKEDVEMIKQELYSIKIDLEELKEMFEGEKEEETEPVFKQRQTAKHKQTAVYDVQTAVQTAVQAAFFTKLSTSEKAIIVILLNSDMKLSYEDLAAMMGKDTATIRGQVNSIKQKCNGLIEEYIEKNNKKRLFIPDKIRGILLKKVKVRTKRAGNRLNNEENS